jgi:hypothetical protein
MQEALRVQGIGFHRNEIRAVSIVANRLPQAAILPEVKIETNRFACTVVLGPREVGGLQLRAKQ